MLLFLAAEASADAGEMAQWVRPEQETDNLVESALISALRDLALAASRRSSGLTYHRRVRFGDPTRLTPPPRPCTLLSSKGVLALALQMLGTGEAGTSSDPLEFFRKVKSFSTSDGDHEIIDVRHGPVSVFSGPGHLASILIAVARDMSRGAVVSLPPPKRNRPQPVAYLS